MKYIATESIPNGTKFVAIYGDGSGADLYCIDDDGHLWDSDGEHIHYPPDNFLMDSGYAYWLLLPKTFKLWFER